MHYPHKTSNIKRARKIGFRARMKTKKGRQTINRKRRAAAPCRLCNAANTPQRRSGHPV